ncbi:MFS transporter [Phreatobacter oligotrophus]|uniref:Putative MFS family arabinose efflux permease n=1 Tax=Phreatobacter oligotrophus TaxID=1122261 RepID=A0A2T4YXL1_9HYPH|nr:MFS transporter [Phreatobacter oligotrophus]PTM51077.1 putative MFS family arabinose efflux permease [Phreatobacter oligotrophus]
MTASAPSDRPASDAAWRTPFVIVLCGCLIGLLSFGPRSVVGMFLMPISTDNGWTRDILSLTIAIQNLMWGVGQPFAGAVADRFGTLRVFWAGAIMYGLGLACMVLPLPPLAMHVLSGTLVGLGLAGVSFNLVLACFAKLLPESKRAQAMGLGTAASSFGQFVFAPLTPFLVDLLGWKAALLIFSCVPLVIIPLSFALATSPSSGQGQGTGAEMSIAATLKQAFAHPSYVFLVIGFFTCGFQLAFITTHYPTYLKDLNMPAWVAGSALALIGLFNIVGSLGAGWLAARMSKRWLLAYIYFARGAAVILLFVFPPSTALALVFAALMGLLWLSTVPPTSGLVALMFGTRYMAMLYGFVFFSHQVGGFLGAWLGGVMYERTGSYEVMWYLSILFCIGSGLINLPIKERPVAQPAPVPAE